MDFIEKKLQHNKEILEKINTEVLELQEQENIEELEKIKNYKDSTLNFYKEESILLKFNEDFKTKQSKKIKQSYQKFETILDTKIKQLEVEIDQNKITGNGNITDISELLIFGNLKVMLDAIKILPIIAEVSISKMLIERYKFETVEAQKIELIYNEIETLNSLQNELIDTIKDVDKSFLEDLSTEKNIKTQAILNIADSIKNTDILNTIDETIRDKFLKKIEDNQIKIKKNSKHLIKDLDSYFSLKKEMIENKDLLQKSNKQDNTQQTRKKEENLHGQQYN